MACPTKVIETSPTKLLVLLFYFGIRNNVKDLYVFVPKIIIFKQSQLTCNK